MLIDDEVSERLGHIEHIAERGAPLPADETKWLLGIARAAIEERDEYRDVVSICASTIANATESLDAVMVAHSE